MHITANAFLRVLIDTLSGNAAWSFMFPPSPKSEPYPALSILFSPAEVRDDIMSASSFASNTPLLSLAYYSIRHQPKCNGHRSITRSYKSCSAVSSISQMDHISTVFLNCSHQTSPSKCQDSEVLTDETFRCFYSLTLLASSLAVNAKLKASKRPCWFHFKFIPVLSTVFFFFFSLSINLPQQGAESCPVPALPTRKLLVSAFCQQSCLYRTHHTNIRGINAEQALTQNCAPGLRAAHSPLPGKVHSPAEMG